MHPAAHEESPGERYDGSGDGRHDEAVHGDGTIGVNNLAAEEVSHQTPPESNKDRMEKRQLLTHIIKPHTRNLRNPRPNHRKAHTHAHPRMRRRILRTEPKRPDSCRGEEQGREHDGETTLRLRQTVSLLPGLAVGETIREEEVKSSAEDASDEAAEVDEAGVVAPEVGQFGEELGADGGDGYEAAEEAAVAGKEGVSGGLQNKRIVGKGNSL